MTDSRQPSTSEREPPGGLAQRRRTVDSDALAFLPAALEIQEAPPSPIGRAVLWTVMGLCVSAVAWASLGKVDIVAVASGKVVPNDRVKVIQSVGLGTVKSIRVRDGQRVKAGEILIELDPTLAEADRVRSDDELTNAELELARSQAFHVWLTGRQSSSPKVEGTLATSQSPFAVLQRSMLEQSVNEHRSRLAVIDQTLARRRADLEATRQQVQKLERTLPLIAQRAESMRRLAEQKLFPQTQYLEVEQQRIEAEQDLETERANLDSVRHSIQELTEQRRALNAEVEREALARIEELNKRITVLRQERVKTAQVATQQLLTAPVDGEVQQLAVHTIGGVVEPGDPLMVIVPAGGSVEVEALVLNKDIGFVRDGQFATVKVDSFPFTRYGAIEGELVSVSDDAMQDERLGLVYATRVQLERSEMNIDGKTVRLSPGMAVSVEVKTGRRRVVEYLLSPITQRTAESMRER
jgi:hemolysin D